jgi:beta-lactamase superfamily II metal-dependent hydrolase
MLRLLTVFLAALAAGGAFRPAARLLDIYWIDVEGGASTLIVTAAGQSLLMDTGYAGFDDRDPARIEHVLTRETGLKIIDYVLTSHFHGDHVGGLASLARRVSIGTFVDHGDSIDAATAGGRALWQQYLKTVGTKRRSVRPGDRLALTGVDVTIVASDGRALTSPLGGAAPNASCAAFTRQPDDPSENGRSLGYHLRAGTFDFLDLGDLSWNFQHTLVCPNNLLGTIDLLQAPHHAVRDDVLPQLLAAVTPTVAVMNNGPTKGGGPVAVAAVLASPGLEDAWSLHRALGNDAAHNAPEAHTANLGATDSCAGAWIRARVNDDGTFVVTNSRNGYSKTYRVR